MKNFRLVWLESLAIAILFSVLAWQLQGQEVEAKLAKLEFLDCTVVDTDGRPLENVQVIDCDRNYLFFELHEPGQITTSHLTATDLSGKFRVERRTNDPMGLAAFLIAEGKACDFVSSAKVGLRPFQVRMQSESNIEVVVYDERMKPIQNAKVAPKESYFPNSRGTNQLSNAVIQQLQTRTDISGRTRLKGASAKHLQSVQVDLDGKGSRSFFLPENWDRDSTLELVWPDFQGSLRCKVVDNEGVPMSNVLVSVRSSEEAANGLVIKRPTVEFSASARTDDRGECLINDIPVDQVDVQIAYDFRRGVHVSAGPVSILPNLTVTVELKFPETRQVQFSVVDTSHSLGHPNIEVVFRKRTHNGVCFARVRTEEDGIGEVTLELGTWEIGVANTDTLPDGYYLSELTEIQEIVVGKEDAPKPVPPILIAKGRVLEGSMEGVDLAELRADWISVLIPDSAGREFEYRGKHDQKGSFRITLPLDCRDDKIGNFAFGRGSLNVISKSPWKLTWKPEP